MKNSGIVVIAALLLFSACKEKQADPVLEAQYLIEINNPANIELEDFIVDVDTIRLELSDVSVMHEIKNIHIMGDRYYISTWDHATVYIFDSRGKYINKIMDKGNGPSEYISVTSFEVDRVNKRVILADNFSRRIFVYDENGNQLNVIQLDFGPIIILPYEDGFINVYSGPRHEYQNPEMENYNIHFLDSQGKFISSAIEIGTPERIDIGSRFKTDCLENGEILFQPVLSDIIYKIEEGKKVMPLYGLVNKSSKHKFLSQKDKETFEYIVRIGDDKKSQPQEKESEGFLLSWGSVKDLNDYVFFAFGYNKKYYLYYSKSLDKSIFIDIERVKGDKNLVDMFFSSPKSIHGNRFYISPHPLLIDQVKDQLPDGILKTFFENTHDDLNPVLISFSIKFPE
ncbi:6-bladed beta-propeller [uncultured Proteiniphilum sp.]|uniref:6-bladed beta-propeller n=1 Tax=uncultured Proteiniphilum sp. TaxID=497637 RepID=UPI00260AA63C|nr:6-bladed beta-propeller [uncultured Proteiniphilum sp.]